MSTQIPAVFPVISYKIGQSLFQSHGSAFFINASGVFVTAGHNFKYPTRTFKAVINGIEYLFTKLYHEYNDFEDQLPPFYQDLFIGRIEGFTSPNYYELGNETELNAGSILTTMGYQLSDQLPVIPMDDIYDDLIGDGEEKPLPTPNTIKLSRLQLQPIPTTFTGNGFQHIDKHSELTTPFTNGFAITIPVEEPHGHSGGPVMSTATVYGMLIGETGVIGATYILEKLQQAAPLDPEVVARQLALPVNDQNRWLSERIANVHQALHLPGSPYAAQYQHVYYVSAAEVTLLQNPVSPLILRGIGGAQSNYHLAEKGELVHLVVINPDVCDEANFSAAEIEAAIIHELGHLFNMYTPQSVPTVMDSFKTGIPFNQQEVDSIKYENRVNNEYYADDYAKQHERENQVIRGLEKYSKLSGSENEDMIYARITKLKEEGTFLNGTIKPLNTIPS
jgi:hypothetical protein